MILPKNKTELAHRGNKIVYDLGDRIVKVFNETKPVSDVFNEALTLARINEAGIPSPRALEVAQIESDDFGWALVTSKVPGVTLESKIDAEPQRFGEFLEAFIDLQIDIHAHTAPLLNRQRDKYTRMIDSLDQIDATTRYNLLERLDGMKKEFKVCHGDFNPSNVIVSDDETLSVCDWAHATQGSPAADVAMTYLLFSLNSKEQADMYLDLYSERRGAPMQGAVRQWLPIIAASELARKRSIDERFLMGWIDVFDYQ
ncbi:aminoglycoside phosphotransferase [Coriobacterium glomerans PW2]|uniref:Aminoglycoside phosphotransferase n=1 Tax=Coriobacterium glomerans (strain ATCC 49209 / DSM 20642 / JCM 10262 / PW2) TaxID=700015 RepID=F2N9S2_CORGP|nr:aminoglycoside phosphotransferase family protein [Coriobacterium glomerans]AEB07175.1 aminoglycoside phosphotransferase [Coriobacterium glomerans PW2]